MYFLKEKQNVVYRISQRGIKASLTVQTFLSMIEHAHGSIQLHTS